jgi:hypothetical protein
VSDVLVNGRLRALERGGTLTFDVGPARAAAVIVGRPRLRTDEIDHHGVHIVAYTRWARPVPSAPDQFLPYLPANRVGRILDAVKETVDLVAELGAPMPEGTRLVIVEGALRMELGEALPGFAFVSDEIFDIFPITRFLKFHEFELVRVVLEGWIESRVAERERADDLGWAAQVASSLLVDRYTLRSYRRTEYARQILGWASFIPAIDRILYAPQVPFASAYFYTLEDDDPLRDNLAQFANTRPRGKLIYAKLRDLLGDDDTMKLVRAQLHGSPVRAAAESVRGASLDWFWRQWLTRYPKVDYRFRDVRSERVPTGWRHIAVVEKVGDTPPVEPVEVRAVDVRGHAETQRWEGDGKEHTYSFAMPAALSSIELDPRGRLVEDLPKSNDDLKFDDLRPPRWKFIYNNFGGLVTFFPTLGLDLSLDFSLAPILDIKNAMRFLVYHTVSTQIGVSASYTRSFGRKVTQARLTSEVTGTLAVARIDPSFGRAVGAGENPGTQIATGVGVGYDDRLFVWEPVRALSVAGSGSYTLTVLDNRQVLSQGTVAASWESIVRLGDGHGLAMSLSGAITFGDLRIARQMLAAGGAGGLRGYGVDELLGRGRAIARVEYRHVFVHSLDINLLHSLYIRGVGGGLFAEGGFTTACGSYSVDATMLSADVGYTLRVFADWFGVSQTTLNIDLAVPLVRRDHDCFGPLAPASSRAPIGFYFAFGPPW